MIAISNPAELRVHMMSEFPKEGCGLILKNGEFVPRENKAKDPETTFFIPVESWAPYGDELAAIIHSHRPGQNYPSGKDIQGQLDTGVAWGLVTCDDENCSNPWFWGDMFDPPELMGRKFRHGPSGTDGKGDCYAAIRDWYKLELNLVMKEFARDWFWWAGTENHYVEKFSLTGLRQLSSGEAKDPQVGDIFFCRMSNYKPPHHAGVYLGGGMIYHHPVQVQSWTGCSARARVERWLKFITHWVRLKDDHGLPTWRS